MWGNLVSEYIEGRGYHHSQGNIMEESMGNMMRAHLGEPPTLAALLSSRGIDSVMMSKEAHHPLLGLMGQIHLLTTYIVFLLTPLILAGTLFLLIVWIR